MAFNKWKNDEQFIVVINMSANPQPVVISLDQVNTNKSDSLFFTDVLAGDIFTSSGNKLKVNMQPYSTKLLLATKGAFASDR